MASTQLLSGNGAPNGVVFGNPGDLYENTAGGSGTTFYVKESGANTSTGWIAYGEIPPNVQQEATAYSDFYTDADLSFHVNGATVVCADPQSQGLPPNVAGVVVLEITGAAGSQAFLTLTNGTDGIVLGHGVFEVTWRAAVTMTLAGAANGATDYSTIVGANPANNGPGGDPGLTFVAGIAKTGNTHWWAQVVAGANTPPNVDTGVAVVADGMHTFRIVYDSTLVTPSAKYYIDGVLVATITASLPVNLTVERVAAIYNSTLVANHPQLLADYCTMSYTFATPR